MRKRDWIAIFLLITSAAIAWVHGKAASAGNAQSTKAFLSTIGANTHLSYTSTPYGTAANVLSDLQYAGITNVRDWWLNSALGGQASYATLAAAGIKFDMGWANGNYTNECATSAASVLAGAQTLLDNFVTTYPGSVNYVEGINEPQNFSPCYFDQFTTNAATVTGSTPLVGANATLNFAATPPGIAILGKSQTSVNFQPPGGVATLVTDSSQPGPFDPGSQYVVWGGAATTTLAVTVTLHSANEVLVAETAEVGGPITGITDTLGLTWHMRVQQACTPGFSTPAPYVEEWYAIGPSGGSFPQTDTITLTQTTAQIYFNAYIAVIPGANTSTPFDGSVVSGTTDPLTITTTHANTVVLGNFFPEVAVPSTGPGYGLLGTGDYQLIEYQGFSTTQSGLSVTLGAGAGTTTGSIADAVLMLSAPAQPAISSGTTIWQTTATTVQMNANVIGGGVLNGDTIQFQNTGFAASLSWQGAISALAKSDANLAGVKVLNLSGYPQQVVPGYADYYNDHPYPNYGWQPFSWSRSSLWAAGNSGLSGFVITEDGYYTPGDNGNGVDQLTQARGNLNIIFDSFYSGSPNVYLYELIDETASCTAGCWGIFGGASGTTPKTAATALHNLSAILADSGGAFTPGSLNYTVSNLPLPQPLASTTNNVLNAGGWSFLLEKSTGTFEIVVWNEPPMWNSGSNSDITPTPISSVVNLGATFSTVNVYDPISGTSPISTHSGVSSVTLSLGADPLIVECVP